MPRANPSIAVVSQPFLSAEECDAWIAAAGDAWEPGRVALPPGSPGSAGDRIRRASVAAVTDRALLARLEREVVAYNAALFGFDLDGLSEADPPAFMRYVPGDHFDWHVDNSLAEGPSSTRKLSFTVQLSDPGAYEGGNLELALYAPAFYGPIAEAQVEQTRQRGSLVVFASFHVHRVSPVTRGERIAVVGWVHGPAFR